MGLINQLWKRTDMEDKLIDELIREKGVNWLGFKGPPWPRLCHYPLEPKSKPHNLEYRDGAWRDRLEEDKPTP